MQEFELSAHARDMIAERRIPEEWIWRTLQSPDRVELGADDNQHYFKAIDEYANRVLRVLVNEHLEPHRIVTVFFDRRQRRPA